MQNVAISLFMEAMTAMGIFMNASEISAPGRCFLFFGWLVGWQALARLQGCSPELRGKIGQLRRTVDILHNTSRRHPFGSHSCSVDTEWMLMNLLRTADMPPNLRNSLSMPYLHLFRVAN